MRRSRLQVGINASDGCRVGTGVMGISPLSEGTDSASRPTDHAAAVVLDLTGLKCPLPALRTRKALRALAPGTRLRVTATDPLAGLDVPNAAREEGAFVEAQSCVRGGTKAPTAVATWYFTIRAAG